MNLIKKIVIGFIICFLLTGCNNKVGGWELDLDSNRADIDEKALEVFNEVASDKYEVVALLGKQIVSGINYMFLCRDDSYKIIVIYNNLEGQSTIIHENEFDFTKYTNENISYDREKVIGGWNVEIPDKKTNLGEEVQEAFNNASKKTQGITYYPITVLGHQLVSGTNYALLSYGTVESTKENMGVYLLTLYKDLHGTEEIVSSAYIDLQDYNQ